MTQKKAFDSLDRDCLWYKLLALGIHGRFYKAIQSLYTNVSCAVRVNGNLSDWFSVDKGVKQGCLLSPALFSVYINSLACELNDLQLGVDCDGRNVSLLMYADDVVLIAPSSDHLQSMLDRVSSWCSRWRLEINQDKTKVIHFRTPSRPLTAHTFTLCNLDIDTTDSYKYLGLVFHEHLDLRQTTKMVAQAATRGLGKMISRFKSCGFNVYDCFTELFDACVMPVSLYGAGIWGHKISTIQNRACRYFLGVPTQSPNVGTRGEMGWMSTFSKSRYEVTRLWCRLVNMDDDDRLTKHIFHWSKRLSSPRCKNWAYFARALFDRLGIPDIFNASRLVSRQILRETLESLSNIDHDDWYIALWNDKNNVNGNKLRRYRLFKQRACVEPYMLLNLHRLQRRSLAMLRIGVLPLHVETGRYYGTPLCDRKCTLCSHDCIENEIHFLIDCSLYSDQRQALFKKACELDGSFLQLSQQGKFISLMSEPRLQPVLCKTVNLMFNRRRIFVKRN